MIPQAEQLMAKFALHDAIASSEETETVLAFLNRGLATLLLANDERWTTTNLRGNSILHIASLHSRCEVIKWIRLKLGNIFDSKLNYDGYTPLDALKAKLDKP